MVAQLLRLRSPPAPGDAADGVAVALTHLLIATRQVGVLPPGHRRAMIATVSGVLAEREADSLVVQTDGGVGYAVTVPAGVAERLPAPGARVSLYTELVVKEDGWALYGFDRPVERLVFQRLLGASGFGPKLALALLSALGPERTVRSILARDLAALSSVSGDRPEEGGAAGARAAGPVRRRARRAARPAGRRRRRRGAGAGGPGLRRRGPPTTRCGPRWPAAPPPRTPRNSSAGRCSSSPRGEGDEP